MGIALTPLMALGGIDDDIKSPLPEEMEMEMSPLPEERKWKCLSIYLCL